MKYWCHCFDAQEPNIFICDDYFDCLWLGFFSAYMDIYNYSQKNKTKEQCIQTYSFGELCFQNP